MGAALMAAAGVVSLQVPAQAATITGTVALTSGSVTRSGVLTVNGTVTCNEVGFVYLYVYATQVKRNAEADDTVLASPCSPTPTAWSLTWHEYIRPGTFKAGPAYVSWAGDLFGDTEENAGGIFGRRTLVLTAS